MALRLYLLAAQTADRAGINFENNAYDFYVEVKKLNNILILIININIYIDNSRKEKIIIMFFIKKKNLYIIIIIIIIKKIFKIIIYNNN